MIWSALWEGYGCARAYGHACGRACLLIYLYVLVDVGGGAVAALTVSFFSFEMRPAVHHACAGDTYNCCPDGIM